MSGRGAGEEGVGVATVPGAGEGVTLAPTGGVAGEDSADCFFERTTTMATMTATAPTTAQTQPGTPPFFPPAMAPDGKLEALAEDWKVVECLVATVATLS